MAIKKEVLDHLLAGHDPPDVFGKGGLVDELKKALSERILNAEIDDYLGYGTPLPGSSQFALTLPIGGHRRHWFRMRDFTSSWVPYRFGSCAS